MSQSMLGGRYRVERRLGAGGMAEVFYGFDTVLNRPVAIKILAPQYARDASFVDRFRREAQAAARLNHPNVVAVYDSGSDDGTHFIVMEFVEGRTLADFLAKGGKLAPAKAVEIAERIADALQAAHTQGVIHRDVKSANVMVTREGTVKVMDFGIARMAEGDNVTQTAAVLGTASYLSPEQAQGRPVDARSDIYSLGVVLYEMLTGGVPFVGDTAVAVAYKHVQETPPLPSTKNPEVSPALDAVVMRAMAKNPANRYQTAEEFRQDLERVQRGEMVQATPLLPGGGEATQVISRSQTQMMPPATPEERKTNPWLIALIVVLVLLVLGGALYLLASSLLNGGPSPSPTPSPIAYVSVLNERQALAEQDLKDAGFTNVRVATQRVTDPNDPSIGTVVKQDPDPSSTTRLLKNAKITITVARGPSSVTVPSDLVGQDVQAATAELHAVGLEVVTQKQSSDQTPGTVLDVSPPAGTPVDPASTVTLTVAEAPAQVTVPDVTCESFGAAKHDLHTAGLNGVTSSETRPPNPSCPLGNKVALQDPAGGATANPGDTVTLYPGEPNPSPS
jgi:eukaryotic-like serine/threonine-protein kinase